MLRGAVRADVPAVRAVLRATQEAGRSELCLVQAQDSLVDPQVEFTAREVSLNPETGSYRELD